MAGATVQVARISQEARDERTRLNRCEPQIDKNLPQPVSMRSLLQKNFTICLFGPLPEVINPYGARPRKSVARDFSAVMSRRCEEEVLSPTPERHS